MPESLTLGPWEVVEASLACQGFVWAPKSPSGAVICLRPGEELNHGHAAWPQNARLIAAAPDLLAVAKGCLGYFEYMKAQRSDFTPDEAWLAPLCAAVAKAEGSDGK